MINFLVWLESSEPPNMKVRVQPYNIPVGLCVCESHRPGLLIRLHPCASPPERLFSDLFDYIVPYLTRIQNYFVRQLGFEVGSSFL